MPLRWLHDRETMTVCFFFLSKQSRLAAKVSFLFVCLAAKTWFDLKKFEAGASEVQTMIGKPELLSIPFWESIDMNVLQVLSSKFQKLGRAFTWTI